MKHIVGVATMKVSTGSDTLVTHALASCMGVALYDPGARVGGLLHVLMPSGAADRERALANPCLFVDTAIPHLVKTVCAAGARRTHLHVKVAGGADAKLNGDIALALGKRNYAALKITLAREGFAIEGQDVGGTAARTLELDVGTGTVRSTSNGTTKEL